MKFETILHSLIGRLDLKDHYNASLVKQLLEYQASLKDNDLNHTLLKTLILNYAQTEKELVQLNLQLSEKQKRIDKDLKAAAEIQKSLLPKKSLELENVEIAWRFEPCEHIGGDIFNIFQLDQDHFGIYMLDVSGHGVSAALVTATVSQFLQSCLDDFLKDPFQKFLPHPIFSPAKVFKSLVKEFPFERFENFFSIVYLIINTKNGELTYSRAGHPYPVLLRNNGTIELLKKGGPVIGVGDAKILIRKKDLFKEGQTQLKKGDKLFIYTDGIVEYENPFHELYGADRFFTQLKRGKDEPVSTIISFIITSLMKFGKGCIPQDDLALLGLEVKNLTKD